MSRDKTDPGNTSATRVAEGLPLSRRFQSTSTEYERQSLAKVINLSDGHTRQPLTSSQKQIISRLPRLYREAKRYSQIELEQNFISTFLELAGQSKVQETDRYLLSYSASCEIEMLASYFRRTSKTVALIEPTFDNTPNILKREGVPLLVLPEEWLTEDLLSKKLAALDCDVIWIVSPNNPTGHYLDKDDFTALLSCCARQGKMLVCDFCFRFFSPNLIFWDQYAALEESGVSYVTIEDTGKTWSTQDLKLGMLVCSHDLFTAMYLMHDDLLLNVSPFVLMVLTEFINDTRQHGLDATILYHVLRNRHMVRRALQSTPLEPVTAGNWAGTMEWIRINAAFTGEDLCSELIQRGVHILPGTNFFWHTPLNGSKFVRIPLTRDPKLIAQALPLIRKTARELSRYTE